MNKVLSVLITTAVILSIGCKSGHRSSGSITVDGEKIDLPYSYCVKHNDAYRLILINHNHVSETEIRNIFRETPDNELSMTLLADSDPMASSVIADNYRQFGIQMKIESEPKKIGDDIKITLTNLVKFTPAMGKFKDKEITVSGTFSARYAGETE